MDRTLLFLVVVAGLFGAGPVLAVQPERMVREDPVTSGLCENWSGSDHYGGPVFGRAAELAVPWEFERSDALWVCASGYTTFHAHFADLTDAERERIAAFLERHRIAELLADESLRGSERNHLEIWLASRIYALRDFGQAERAMVARALRLRAERVAGRTVEEARQDVTLPGPGEDDSSPAAHASATFYRAALLCDEGKIAKGIELAATIDADELAATGLYIESVCGAVR